MYDDYQYNDHRSIQTVYWQKMESVTLLRRFLILYPRSETRPEVLHTLRRVLQGAREIRRLFDLNQGTR